MLALSRFLVPLDGSPIGEQALPLAQELARRTNGTIMLLRVLEYWEGQIASAVGYRIDLPQERDLVEYYQTVRAEGEGYLGQIAARLMRAGLLVETRAVEGERSKAIVGAAAGAHADLIIMATHGRTGLSRWVLGSTTERVLRDASCPVLVLRSNHGPAATSEAPLTRLSSAVVALDGSPLAEQALPVGLALTKALGATLTLLHVQTPDATASYLDSVVARDSDKAQRIRIESLVETDHSAPRVAQAIIDYAERNDVSLVILTTHGHDGLSQWVHGSVTQHILGHCRRALLVVRPSHAP